MPIDLRELGFRSCIGIDPFIPQAVHDRHGTRVRKQKLSEVRETFDAILFRHSLEHMPLNSLALAAPLLRNGGVCVVCIPVIGWAWRHYRTNWVQLDAPRHLWLHTLTSFGMLAEKSGFKVRDVVYDSSEFQFWASEAYSRDIALRDAKPPTGMELYRLKRRAAQLNAQSLGDSAQFYLSRI